MKPWHKFFSGLLAIHWILAVSGDNEDVKLEKTREILGRAKNSKTLKNLSSGKDIISVVGEAFVKLELEEKTLEELHSAGVTFNEEDELGRSLLFYAIEGYWELEPFQKLVELGADIHHLDKDKQNIFVQVLYRNIALPSDIAEYILSQGLSPLKTDIRKDSLLSITAKLTHRNLIEALIKSGMDVNAVDDEGHTLLQYLSLVTATKDHKEMEEVPPLMEYVIEKGADVHFVDKNSNLTFLHYSSMFGSEEMMKILLENGANPNAMDHQGNTPLHVVQPVKGLDKEQSISGKVRLLLEYGAVTNVKNKAGKSPRQNLEQELTSSLAWIEMQNFAVKEENKPKLGVNMFPTDSSEDAAHDEL